MIKIFTYVKSKLISIYERSQFDLQSGACTGFLKGEGSEETAASKATGKPRAAAPAELRAKPIRY